MRDEVIDEIIVALNSMVDADPDALLALLEARVSCNGRLAEEHPTCQTGGENGKRRAGAGEASIRPPTSPRTPAPSR